MMTRKTIRFLCFMSAILCENAFFANQVGEVFMLETEIEDVGEFSNMF